MTDKNLSADDMFGLFKTLVASITSLPNNTPPISETPKSREIIKQFQDEEMIAIEPLYINIGKADAHGDGITDTELDKFVDNFNTNINNIKGNIHHAYMTEGFKPLKAYRLPMNVYIGDTDKPDEMTLIEEGQPVVKVQFYDESLWKQRKSGELAGVSIGALAKRVANPDYKGADDNG